MNILLLFIFIFSVVTAKFYVVETEGGKYAYVNCCLMLDNYMSDRVVKNDLNKNTGLVKKDIYGFKSRPWPGFSN